MAEKKFIRVYPKISLSFLKTDNDITKSFVMAVASSNKLTKTTLARTNFEENAVDAQYISPENEYSGNVITIYRKTPLQTYYSYVCTLGANSKGVSDYNILSNTGYHYLASIERTVVKESSEDTYKEYILYENADSSDRDTYFFPKFSGWTICNIEESTESGVYYKTGTTWNLGLNYGEENLTHNMSITTWDTLNKYPKISIGNKAYDSMTFQGLLGQVFEYNKYNFSGETNKETLEEEKAANPLSSAISKNYYGYTEKDTKYSSSTGWQPESAYSMETDKLIAWKKFIEDGELKFIRDSKGHGWVGMISDSAEYNINNISNLKQTTITFSWKEVLDVNDISIISQEEE